MDPLPLRTASQHTGGKLPDLVFKMLRVGTGPRQVKPMRRVTRQGGLLSGVCWVAGGGDSELAYLVSRIIFGKTFPRTWMHKHVTN